MVASQRRRSGAFFIFSGFIMTQIQYKDQPVNYFTFGPQGQQQKNSNMLIDVDGYLTEKETSNNVHTKYEEYTNIEDLISKMMANIDSIVEKGVDNGLNCVAIVLNSKNRFEAASYCFILNQVLKEKRVSLILLHADNQLLAEGVRISEKKNKEIPRVGYVFS